MLPGSGPDLRCGSVLHIKDYSTRGHPAKNKYLLIIGKPTDSEALGFLVSSRLSYLAQETYKNEVVRIPRQATAIFPVESIIQCFQLEYLSVGSLCSSFERKLIENKGLLAARYLYKVRDTVRTSILLAQADIDIALKVLP